MLLPALTLHDPWASLVMAGIKTIETRKSPVLSGFSGPLIIHRSMSPEVKGYHDTPPNPWGKDDISGVALGVVRVVRTFRLTYTPSSDELLVLQKRACFPDLAGRYLSVLEDATWFPEPLPARGTQGRWKLNVPDRLLPAWVLDTQQDGEDLWA
jgi:hypothetical protein